MRSFLHLARQTARRVTHLHDAAMCQRDSGAFRFLPASCRDTPKDGAGAGPHIGCHRLLQQFAVISLTFTFLREYGIKLLVPGGGTERVDQVRDPVIRLMSIGGHIHKSMEIPLVTVTCSYP
jgi:hypothetical protein